MYVFHLYQHTVGYTNLNQLDKSPQFLNKKLVPYFRDMKKSIFLEIGNLLLKDLKDMNLSYLEFNCLLYHCGQVRLHLVTRDFQVSLD